MALILNIDTALQQATICISNNNIVIAEQGNSNQYSHASFLQPAIKRILEKAKISLADIDAVAVVNGPGSYTGLRVGLASAKGLCYALHKPLILINTLELMAFASANNGKWKMESGKLQLHNEQTLNLKPETLNPLHCPMIDARRMEVFTALYNDKLEEITPPSAEIIDKNFLNEKLEKSTIIFSGNGSSKFQHVCNSANAIFSNNNYSAAHISFLSSKAFAENKFADPAYCEPFYIKAFYTAKPL